MNSTLEIAKKVRAASREIMTAGTEKKNLALSLIADELLKSRAFILAENEKDLALAEKNGMSKSMLDRLALSEERINGISSAVRELVNAQDPVGKILDGSVRPNGLKIEKVSVPLGVVAVIYEARPNVTVDSAVLCLKAGNAVVLRGGKEAFNSNRALVSCMKNALSAAGFSPDVIGFIEDTSRASSTELMKLNGLIDVLIPRGGAGLIRACVENSTVPVIETGTGNCHTYVDEFADIEMAVSIIENAKLSRPSVCNACESLVIHSSVLKEICERLDPIFKKAGVTVHADERSLPFFNGALPATVADFATEYLALEISVKTVDSLDEAIAHIMKNTTGHSECIVTENYSNAVRFADEVDCAAVYVNASTRFTDGGEFGFGAEIGISTQKLHARGPLGLANLVTFKFKVFGNGQIR